MAGLFHWRAVTNSSSCQVAAERSRSIAISFKFPTLAQGSRRGRRVAAGPRNVIDSCKSERGFSLVEVVVAAGLLAGAVALLGQFFGLLISETTSARTSTFAAILAEQKMEQLRALTWGFDTGGAPLSDLLTNLTLPAPTAGGGKGLSASPPGTLQSNVDGYFDYVDNFGRAFSGGPSVPDRAVYIRRWSVEPIPANPDTLVLQVLVTKWRNRDVAASDGAPIPRLRDEALAITMKARKGR